MCQIISKSFTSPMAARANIIEIEINSIIRTLNIKGSDEYSLFCYSEKPIEPLIIKSRSEEEFREDLKVLPEYLEKIPPFENVGMVWFSRQKPEEEEKEINLPPYYNSNYNKWFWVHGTIHNDKEILNEIDPDLKISVDTEIFSYLNDETFHKIKGLFTYFELDWTNKHLGVQGVDKGMGLWRKWNTPYPELQCSPIGNNSKYQKIPESLKKVDIISIAFSGGMDITLSTYKLLSDVLKSKKYPKVILNYFKYGSNAENIEIERCRNLTEFYMKAFKELNIEFRVMEVPGLIYNMAEVSGEYLKLTDKEAEGDSKEAEENLAYIPYRNTLFCMALNAKLQNEAPRHSNNIIALGLNLSEGMVFGDNNSAWVEQMESMLKYGGKFYQEVNIVSPYINRTKTNTLKDFQDEFGKARLTELLDLSFSCYYPKDGKECGKCGSCILRNKAIKNLI